MVWVNDPTCTLLKCEGNRLFIFSSFSEVITIIRSKSGFFFFLEGEGRSDDLTFFQNVTEFRLQSIPESFMNAILSIIALLVSFIHGVG